MFKGANTDKLRAMADKLNKFAAKLDQVRMVLEVLVFASIFFGPFGGAIRAILKIIIRALKMLSMIAKTAAGVLNGNIFQQLAASAAGAVAARYVPPSVLPVETTRQIAGRVATGIMRGDGYGVIARDIFGAAAPTFVARLPASITNPLPGVTVGANGVGVQIPVGGQTTISGSLPLPIVGSGGPSAGVGVNTGIGTFNAGVGGAGNMRFGPVNVNVPTPNVPAIFGTPPFNPNGGGGGTGWPGGSVPPFIPQIPSVIPGHAGGPHVSPPGPRMPSDMLAVFGNPPSSGGTGWPATGNPAGSFGTPPFVPPSSTSTVTGQPYPGGR